MAVVAVPFGKTGKILLFILTALLLSIWIMTLIDFRSLPERVPTHFNFSGEPNAYGSKDTFLLTPIALSLAPVIIILVSLFRFKLLNDHPYMLNLPAFFTYINNIPEQRRGYWLNRYFHVVLGLGIAITAYSGILLLEIDARATGGFLPKWFASSTVAVPIVAVAFFIYILSRLSKEMKKETV